MAAITYYVVLPFVRNGDGDLVAEDGVEVPNASEAILRALAIVGRKAGVVAFSRTGDANLGEYRGAEMLARLGDIPPEIGS